MQKITDPDGKDLSYMELTEYPTPTINYYIAVTDDNSMFLRTLEDAEIYCGEYKGRIYKGLEKDNEIFLLLIDKDIQTEKLKERARICSDAVKEFSKIKNN